MVKSGSELTRAYKTPSLRGAATRPPYMHAGQFSSLDEVVAHYANAARIELNAFDAAVTDWEMFRGFERL